MGKIRFITITGRPRAGKSQLITLLRAVKPELRMFPGQSYITRPPRPDDVPGEYKYVTDHEFDRMRRRDQFLWIFPHGAYRVGTKRSDVTAATQSAHVSIMTLIPEAVPLLVRFVGQEHVASFFVEAPEAACIERIKKQTTGVDATLARFEKTAGWTQEHMWSLGVRFIPVQNPDEVPPGKTMLTSVLTLLNPLLAGRGII